MRLKMPLFIFFFRETFNYKSNENIDGIISKMIDFIKTKGPKDFSYNYRIEINNNLTPDTWSKKII